MVQIQQISICLPLSGAKNVRDLGGYKTKNGKSTKKNVFLRAAKLDELTDADKEFLYGYGVRTVVDLRSPVEIAEKPCGVHSYRDIRYENVPLIDNIHSDNLEGRYPPSMSQMYIGLLENSTQLIRQALYRLAEEPKCALFNCTAGKDRTGVMAMLLLKLAEVDSAVIIDDYSASEKYNTDIKIIQEEVKEQFGILLPDYLFESKPEQMEQTLEFFDRKYCNAPDYMRTIGLSNADIEKLAAKFID